jgi:ABC-type bacteriocin/lantibiotic exporter with double-glycine peptidase domain
LLSKDIEFYDHFKPGEIMSRFNDDFWSLYHLGPENLMSIALLIIKLLASTVALLFISPELSGLHVILFLYEIYKNYGDIKNSRAKWNPYELVDKMSCLASESIHNIRSIKAFSTERKEVGKMSEQMDKLAKIRVEQKKQSTNEFRAFLWKVMGVINVWYAGGQVLSGQMALGNLTTFQILSQEIKGVIPDLSWKIGHVF